MKIFAEIKSWFELPPLDQCAIPERPRRNVSIEGSRTTTAKIVNGKQHTQRVDDDGTIVTTIGKQRPSSSNDVVIDKFDAGFLDVVVGVKWRKDEQRAAIMKWHWLNEQSARQIEIAHTDNGSKQLERGFSERTVAEYIRAFYDADDERERRGIERIHAVRGSSNFNQNNNTPPSANNVVEW